MRFSGVKMNIKEVYFFKHLACLRSLHALAIYSFYLFVNRSRLLYLSKDSYLSIVWELLLLHFEIWQKCDSSWDGHPLLDYDIFFLTLMFWNFRFANIRVGKFQDRVGRHFGNLNNDGNLALETLWNFWRRRTPSDQKSILWFLELNTHSKSVTCSPKGGHISKMFILPREECLRFNGEIHRMPKPFFAIENSSFGHK